MPEKGPRLSHQTLRVLRVFLEHPRTDLAGSDIWKQTGLLSGTLYPILIRLERARWLDSYWEELDPTDAGRPRKRLYNLTPDGYNKARKAFAEVGAVDGRLEWSF